MQIKCGRLFISNAFISVGYYLDGKYRTNSFVISFECNCFIDGETRLRFYRPMGQNENPNKGIIKFNKESRWHTDFIKDSYVVRRFKDPETRFINDLLYTLDGVSIHYDIQLDRYQLKLENVLRSTSEDNQVTISIMGFDGFFVWYLKNNLFDAYTQDVDRGSLYSKTDQGVLNFEFA